MPPLILAGPQIRLRRTLAWSVWLAALAGSFAAVWFLVQSRARSVRQAAAGQDAEGTAAD